MTKPVDKLVEMNLDRESPIEPIGKLRGTDHVPGDESNSNVWILTDFILPFFLSQILFWLIAFVVTAIFGGTGSDYDRQMSALAIGAVSGLIATPIAGGVYGWFIGARYLSPTRLGKQADSSKALKSAKNSRLNLVVLQVLYFPACLFGGCAGFVTLAGLFG